jgi:6-phosphogluconolactonase
MPAAIEIAAVEILADRFARMTEGAAARAIADRGSFSFAISGGSAAELALPKLVSATIAWEHVDVFFIDERAVPPESADSNYRLARAAWLDRVPLPPARVHRMRGEAPDLSAAAAEYANALQAMLGNPPRIDLVLLGMGPDGHVASLFPGHRLLRAWDRYAAAVDDAPKPPPRRLTVTLPVLTAARQLVVFATGAAKADALRDALGDAESELPVALATMGAGQATFLLDPDAASKLR